MAPNQAVTICISTGKDTLQLPGIVLYAGTEDATIISAVAMTKPKAAHLGGPDWHQAFERFDDLKPETHDDVVVGRVGVYYYDPNQQSSDDPAHHAQTPGEVDGPATEANDAMFLFEIGDSVQFSESSGNATDGPDMTILNRFTRNDAPFYTLAETLGAFAQSSLVAAVPALPHAGMTLESDQIDPPPPNPDATDNHGTEVDPPKPDALDNIEHPLVPTE